MVNLCVSDAIALDMSHAIVSSLCPRVTNSINTLQTSLPEDHASPPLTTARTTSQAKLPRDPSVMTSHTEAPQRSIYDDPTCHQSSEAPQRSLYDDLMYRQPQRIPQGPVTDDITHPQPSPVPHRPAPDDIKSHQPLPAPYVPVTDDITCRQPTQVPKGPVHDNITCQQPTQVPQGPATDDITCQLHHEVNEVIHYREAHEVPRDSPLAGKAHQTLNDLPQAVITMAPQPHLADTGQTQPANYHNDSMAQETQQQVLHVNNDPAPIISQIGNNTFSIPKDLSVKSEIIGLTVHCLIDTGAAISVVSLEFLQRTPEGSQLPMQEARLRTVNTVSGEQLTVVGQV